MEMKHYFMIPALAGVLITGCTDDDNVAPENRAHDTFREMYPDVTAVEWERENSYYVAEFRVGSHDKEAWFDGTGNWQLTETELPYADLPEAVRLAHEAGDFADWIVDDVDFVERKDRETIYVLEVERGNTEYDLYYLEDGTLVKAFPDNDNDNDYLPITLPNGVSQFLADRYPDYRLVDTDVDDGRIEVELIHGKFKREAQFTTEGDWVYTETEVGLNDVPEAITDVLSESEYSIYRVDDIDFIETPEGAYYHFELELGNDDVEVRIHENGELEVLN